MIGTVTSGIRTFTASLTGTASRQRRSASLTGSSRTASTEGNTGVQTDFDYRAVVESYQRKLQDATGRAEAWKKKAEEAEERACSAEARLAEANRRHEAEKATFNPRAEKPVYEAEHRINELEAALSRSQQELYRTNEELRDTTALLDRRSAELRDAQAYLSHPDDVSDAEVLRLVERLNSRIFQTAASIADASQSRYGEKKDIRVSEERVAHVGRLLGDDLLRALTSIDHSVDTVVVQIALQAIMVGCSHWLCDTWDFGVTGHRQVLSGVYHNIRRTEQQSVAGRWRALSRTYVKRFLNDDEDPEGDQVHGLVRHITDILLVCGIPATSQDLRTEVGSSYADALREVIHLSFEVQRTVGERIISRDLRIFIARSGKPFEPSYMVDDWADPKKAPHGENTHPVLCTTQLGLVREEKKAAEGESEEGIVAVILLKPKVVLTSFLEELLSETSS